ncbi:hypothetical protein [Streptomyces chrestomyceticus]|uniref:hypothetical protein n=1 Tax=Streptomyces chrestomyceticus TaxID=68185 RepID=UPI0033CF3CA0
MELAARYAARYDIAPDRFWADFKALVTLGLAERIVAPAPGRKAVYALVLAYDAIPQDLPEDLARLLRVHDLPDVEDPDEDATYGRLADSQAPEWRVHVESVKEAEAADLQAAPRWEHPPASPAALAAQAIAKTARSLPEEQRPRDLRCIAVASRRSAAYNEPKTSPITRGGFSPGGFYSAGSRGLASLEDLVKTKTTPSAAPTSGVPGFFSGDDPRAKARWVLQRAWHAWRRELGYGRVILTSGRYDEAGQWQSGPTWDDLLRVVQIALRRTTPSHLVEILSASVAGAADVGRLATWRCWNLINSRRDQQHHGKRQSPPTGPRAAAWDDASFAERQRQRAQARAAHLAAEEASLREKQNRRQQEMETRRRLFFERLGIDLTPLREPESVHREQHPDPAARPVPKDFDQLTPQQRAQLAEAQARADRARRGKAPKRRRGDVADEAARQEKANRLADRLRAKARGTEEP